MAKLDCRCFELITFLKSISATFILTSQHDCWPPLRLGARNCFRHVGLPVTENKAHNASADVFGGHVRTRPTSQKCHGRYFHNCALMQISRRNLWRKWIRIPTPSHGVQMVNFYLRFFSLSIIDCPGGSFKATRFSQATAVVRASIHLKYIYSVPQICIHLCIAYKTICPLVYSLLFIFILSNLVHSLRQQRPTDGARNLSFASVGRFVCLLTQPISKSHRGNSANQRLVRTDGNHGSLFSSAAWSSCASLPSSVVASDA